MLNKHAGWEDHQCHRSGGLDSDEAGITSALIPVSRCRQDFAHVLRRELTSSGVSRLEAASGDPGAGSLLNESEAHDLKALGTTGLLLWGFGGLLVEEAGADWPSCLPASPACTSHQKWYAQKYWHDHPAPAATSERWLLGGQE